MTVRRRVEKKPALVESMRRQYRDKIIEDFSKVIDRHGGFKGKSKTAQKCNKLGTLAGIKAFMNRWFLIQKLHGVFVVFSVYHRKTSKTRLSLRNRKMTNGY